MNILVKYKYQLSNTKKNGDESLVQIIFMQYRTSVHTDFQIKFREQQEQQEFSMTW